MATRGRLSSGCPFQLCTAPALASQPPLSLFFSLSLQPPPLHLSIHTHTPFFSLSLPPFSTPPLLPRLLPSCDRGSLSLSHTHLAPYYPHRSQTCTVTVFSCRHNHTSTLIPCASMCQNLPLFYAIQAP